MFTAFEWMLAARYLRARRQEGFISVIAWFSLVGIALGVATLIIVMSVMNGFRIELMGKILGLNGHLVVQSADGTPLTDYEEVAARIKAVEGVRSAVPLIEGQVLATSKAGGASGALVRGMPPADLKAARLVASNIVAGSLDRFQGREAAAVGAELARKLRLGVGDRITLVSPQTTATAFGSVPRLNSYEIVALFRAGMYEYDSTYVYIPLEAAQLYFRLKGAANGVEVRVDDPDRIDDFRGPIFRALGGQARLVDWQQLNSSFFAALEVERNVMFLILTMIILVAAFNVISGLIMLVKDKSQAIAILRTMGAARGTVMRVFFIAGASIGVIGTLAGFVLGTLFCVYIQDIQRGLEALGLEVWNPEIRFLTRIPAVIEANEVIAVVLMALALSFLATLYPAWRAARLDPVEALRYE